MTPDRIAYLAGYFDAKGTISCRVLDEPRRTIDFYVSIGTSSQPQMLDALAARYGGATAWRAPSAKQRSVYVWRVCALQAARFLEAIRPEIRMRQREVDLALQFYATVQAHGGRSVTADTRRLRLRIKAELDGLKKRRRRLLREMRA